MTDVRTAALNWHDAGYAVLPVRTDGSKAPDVASWRDYQHTAPTRDQVDTWYSGNRPGLGVLCGAISGGLEMLELEQRAVDEDALVHLTPLIEAAGLAELWARVAQGYAEHSPSGGLHFLYRIDGGDVPGNTKLASRPARGDELTDREREVLTKHPGKIFPRVLAETRGEGGYVVVAPSHGPTHPTGRAWTVVNGSPATIATITADERDQLLTCFRSLDRMPAPEPVAAPRPLQVVDSGGTKPGDDFEAKTSWHDELLLGGAGWLALYEQGGTTYWRRPGKDTVGFSATTGRDPARDRLYVFSSSTEFDTEVPYTKFGAYALLHHGGDHRAAAKELRRLGYGSPPPAQIPGPRDAQTAHPVDGTAARVLDEQDKRLPHFYGATQDGMALALVDHHGNQIRYVPQREKWLAWNGHQWAWDDAARHRELAKQIARQLPTNEDTWRSFRKSCLSAAGTSGIIQQARSDLRIVAPFDALDANGWDLNTPVGIVDMRTGNLRPSDPDALCTRSTAVPYDPDADQGRWLEFLRDTFGDDQDLISYLQRLVGYSAVGVVGPHVLPFAHGSGGNGKGVFLEALAGVLGDYATTSPNGFLMSTPFPGHETELARLAGARMVICSEVNEEDKFDEAKVKALTGGDSVTARFMRQDHFTFKPTHQLWLMGNHQPAVRSGGRSFWRRIRLIPFEREVPEDKMVDDLQGQLVRDHGPALLAWLVQGAVDYAKGGLREPEKVKAATQEYAHDQDTVARFVEECCRIGGGDHVTIKVSRFREAYESWCLSESLKPVTAKRLGMELPKHGVTRPRDMAARSYGNVSLLATDDDDRSGDNDRGGW